MFFPVAGIEISPWIPPAAAFAISLLTSMCGVSGAFLLLPFQMSVLGFNGPAVSATNHVFNVVATPAGVWRYAREGRMLWPLTWIIAIGTLPGVLAGAVIRIEWLSGHEAFRLFVGVVLLYLGGKLALDLFREARGGAGHDQAVAEDRFHGAIGHPSQQAATVRRFDARRLEYDFCGEAFGVDVPRLIGLSLGVGVIGGIYGIGGGAFIAPLLISFFGMPVYIAAGAALLATFLTSAAAVVFYQLLAPWYPHLAVAPDWTLGLLFGAGGMAGMYCGARLQKFIPASIIKAILAVLILVPAFAYLRSPLTR